MKNTFLTLFDGTIEIINSIIYIIISLAVVGFMWGIVKILFNSDNEIAKKEGRSFMMYGILTLFVMTSMWGLVNILNGTIIVGEGQYIGDVNFPSQDVTSPGEQFPSAQDTTDMLDNKSEQQMI